MSKVSSNLAKKACVPCKGGVPALSGESLNLYLQELSNDWTVIDGHHLKKEYHFNNFREALNFTILIGELAEREGHHPDIYLTWGKVTLTIWTHKIDGLTESDFIFAAKSDVELDKCSTNKACF